jgi:hypothetical protein
MEMDERIKREPYNVAGEGDDEMADAVFRKKKHWEKFWDKSKKELGRKKNKKS